MFKTQRIKHNNNFIVKNDKLKLNYKFQIL
jgi:hypothetical protein